MDVWGQIDLTSSIFEISVIFIERFFTSKIVAAYAFPFIPQFNRGVLTIIENVPQIPSQINQSIIFTLKYIIFKRYARLHNYFCCSQQSIIILIHLSTTIYNFAIVSRFSANGGNIKRRRAICSWIIKDDIKIIKNLLNEKI